MTGWPQRFTIQSAYCECVYGRQLTRSSDMLGNNNVLLLELRGDNSLGNGRYEFLNPLRHLDAAVTENRSPSRSARMPSQAAQRGDSARITSARFGEAFGLLLLRGIGPTDYKEVIGGLNEWYILSARLSGDTFESVSNRHYRIGACSCYLVRYRRGMNHVLQSVSQLPLTEACVAFRPSALSERIGCTAKELEGLLECDSRGRGLASNSLEMTSDMEAIVRELHSLDPTALTFSLLAEAKSLELISQYLRGLSTPAAHQTQERDRSRVVNRRRSLLRVRRYLEINYHKRCSIAELSRIAGLSRKLLTSTFKREFGAALQQYHQMVRMEIACAMLRRNSYGMTPLADLLGYEHPANFTKAFSGYSGMCPTEYVATHKATPSKARLQRSRPQQPAEATPFC